MGNAPYVTYHQRIAASAAWLLDRYADMRSTEEDPEPDLTAAALDDVQSLLHMLRSRGFGEGSAAGGIAKLSMIAERHTGYLQPRAAADD